jgi:AcrR family transcriptional regulator
VTTHAQPTRRAQIQNVAEALFRERGYLATSMRDIAEQMDMKGGGSLYAHIKGKEDLLAAIANDAADAFFAALRPVAARDLPPDAKLREAMIAHVLVITDHLGAAAVYFDEWRHLTEPRRSEFVGRRDDYEHMFQGLIHAGIAEGVFAPADERLATLNILSMMNAIRHWYRPGGRLTAYQVAETTAALALNGLYRR